MALRIQLMRCGRLLGHTQRITAVQRPVLIRNTLPRRTFLTYPALRTEVPNPKPAETSTHPEPQSSQGQTAEPTPESPAETPRPETAETPNEAQPGSAQAKPPSAKPDIPPPPPKREVDPKDHELAELKDHYLRSVAEFRNLQAQTRRDVLAAQASTIQRFSIELLDTIDALSKALDTNLPRPPLDGSDPNQREDILVTEHRALHDGVRMIERILLNTLEKHGITVIPTEEEPLPGSHEVVKEVDGQEKDVGKIAGIVRQGYRLNGKVIRPVQVSVCKAKAADSAAS